MTIEPEVHLPPRGTRYRPRWRVWILLGIAVSLAACGSSGSTPKGAAHPPSSTTTVASTTTTGAPGPTSSLAAKIRAAKLGCADYHDIVQDPAQQPGIRDIGNCGFGHLGVFIDGGARDRWVNSQLSQFHMADCAVGVYWAVCLFPGASVNKFEIQDALHGVTTS